MVVVVEEQWREESSHVPLDVVGEHAQEDVGCYPIGEVVVYGAHLEIDALVAAEGPLDAAEALVGADRFGGRECGFGDVGTDDVEAVEGGLLGDALAVALVPERRRWECRRRLIRPGLIWAGYR